MKSVVILLFLALAAFNSIEGIVLQLPKDEFDRQVPVNVYNCERQNELCNKEHGEFGFKLF